MDGVHVLTAAFGRMSCAPRVVPVAAHSWAIRFTLRISRPAYFGCIAYFRTVPIHSHPLRVLAHCILCIAYSVFTPGECPCILRAVAYCVLRIAYWVLHFEGGCVLRIAYCVLGHIGGSILRAVAYCVLRIAYWVLHFEGGCVSRIAYCVLGAPF
jgi:hypothetical protein